MSRLYIVSTPIGHLGDTSHRALAVLGSVARVLAEDTRRTAVLLRHYGLETPLVSLHAHNEAARAQRIVDWLDAGEELALVSDAGTPLLSDPGARIVQRVLEAGHEVVPIPGASALLAALVASGLDPEPFTFFGFTPRAGEARRTRLAQIAELRHVAVLYESPQRLGRLLAELREACGAARRVVVGRELTKLHESFFRGTLEEAAAYYGDAPPRGEIVVVVDGATASEPVDRAALVESARALLLAGRRPSAVARELVARFGLARNQAYALAQEAARGVSPEGDDPPG
jgi:16S rRNA (cytidine1402-2'-O)-methyltransferase